MQALRLIDEREPPEAVVHRCGDPEKKVLLIMEDSPIYKNTIRCCSSLADAPVPGHDGPLALCPVIHDCHGAFVQRAGRANVKGEPVEHVTHCVCVVVIQPEKKVLFALRKHDCRRGVQEEHSVGYVFFRCDGFVAEIQTDHVSGRA